MQNLCASNPCGSNGICSVLPDFSSYVCDCFSPFSGRNCNEMKSNNYIIILIDYKKNLNAFFCKLSLATQTLVKMAVNAVTLLILSIINVFVKIHFMENDAKKVKVINFFRVNII